MENNNNENLDLEQKRKADDRANRTKIGITSKRDNDMKFLIRTHKDILGNHKRGMIEHILKKIIEGDYNNVKPDETPVMRYTHVDKDLRDEAYKVSKELGFSNLKDMLEKIVINESRNQKANGIADREIQFQKIGEVEKQASDKFENNDD